MALCFGYGAASCADLLLVFGEFQRLQFKALSQSRTGTAQQFVEVFSLDIWDHDFTDNKAKQEASGRITEINLDYKTQHLACTFR